MTFELIHGDIRKCTDKLAPFHQIVTSPPYWQQRSYGGRGELGQEEHPSTYINELSLILFRLSERMDPQGTIFVNLGDKRHQGQLCGLPHRLVIKLLDFGLQLKNDLIWHKRRIMPESAKNRFTTSHEYIFMFTKLSKGYTFNHEPVMEDAIWKNDRRAGKGAIHYRELREQSGAGHTAPVVIKDKRICRSVWDIPTSQADKGHHATFPVGLPERCILAGSNAGDVVLDPFAGSCTTGVAALQHCRNFIGVDCNRSFLNDARERLSDVQPLLTKE